MKNIFTIALFLCSSHLTQASEQMLLLPKEESPSFMKEVNDILVSAAEVCTIGPKYISGYWENWKGPYSPGTGSIRDSFHYENDFWPMTHIFYSFLTLAQHPNPDAPANAYWDGQALYESMTQQDVMTVIAGPKQNAANQWQGQKMEAMIKHAKDRQKKWIWAIGGWSDVTMTIQKSQVDSFVSKTVELLKTSGDGVDFDWEHLSQDASLRQQQLETMALTLLKLRQGLDSAGLSDKIIGYTTRFNAFWDDSNRPSGAQKFPSDGEGIVIDNFLKTYATSMRQTVNFINIMMYDVPPSQLGAPDGFRIQNYRDVFHPFEKHFDKDQIVMGFEPGGQAAGGLWEGMAIDEEVINYVQVNGYGGVMFWAINETGFNHPEKTAQNVNSLGKTAQKIFNQCQPTDGPLEPNKPDDKPVKPVDPVIPPVDPTGTGSEIFKEGYYCPYFNPPGHKSSTLADCANFASNQNTMYFSWAEMNLDCILCKNEQIDILIPWGQSTVYRFK